MSYVGFRLAKGLKKTKGQFIANETKRRPEGILVERREAASVGVCVYIHDSHMCIWESHMCIWKSHMCIWESSTTHRIHKNGRRNIG